MGNYPNLPELSNASQTYLVWVPTPDGDSGWSLIVKTLILLDIDILSISFKYNITY